MKSQAGAGARDIRYRGVKRAVVLAQYGPRGEIAGGEASQALGAEIVDLARVNAPVPVDGVEVGDPSLRDGATLVVIVQASVVSDPSGVGRLFAVTARPLFSGGREPAPQYFGAAPLVVRFAETPGGRADRARAINAVLDEVLPWRRRGEGRAAGLTGE
ncbi:hypothetical protein [Sphingomonas aracearum]|uniref:Uncharacterized protein n=1 Tax=Sphingomonas aracearum TaxID=2283317 RepID=A0A369VTE2_9SPHN|nr:hypothetical protein [Sphingomonas aracearum]RDE05313.1 hypothetical protein DVW87_08580 [Sphingomonas aracearum]